MDQYTFETKEFGLSETGIHLLRSRYNYKTIDYGEIDTITIGTDKELNNWWIILFLGLALVAFAIYYTYGLYLYVVSSQTGVIYMEDFVVPVIPLLMGGYCIFMGLRNGKVMRVHTMDGKSKKLSLSVIDKNDQLSDLAQFLNDRLEQRVKMDL